MTLQHLRTNAVAYLALAVALSTGTAYAADQVADGSVTTKKLAKNAVTSAKIRKSAVKASDLKPGSVRSATVKDGSVEAADLAAGVLPRPVEADAVNIAGTSTPSATPDLPNVVAYDSPATSPGGRVVVRMFVSRAAQSCTAGSAEAGLYLDGVPVAGTLRGINPIGGGLAVEWVTEATISPGSHAYRIGYNCPTGNTSANQAGDPTAMVLYLGG
jgi:hypothetical protein